MSVGLYACVFFSFLHPPGACRPSSCRGRQQPSWPCTKRPRFIIHKVHVRLAIPFLYERFASFGRVAQVLTHSLPIRGNASSNYRTPAVHRAGPLPRTSCWYSKKMKIRVIHQQTQHRASNKSIEESSERSLPVSDQRISSLQRCPGPCESEHLSKVNTRNRTLCFRKVPCALGRCGREKSRDKKPSFLGFVRGARLPLRVFSSR